MSTESVDTDTERPEEMWPGVPFAYEFVKPSYDWMLARFEAASTRLQSLQTFAATIMLAGPAIGKSVRSDISFTSGWLIAAIVTTGFIMLLGGVAKSYGAIWLAHPRTIHEKYLRFGEWEFKRTALYWAGEHFEKNVDLVNRKARAAAWMTAFLFVQVILMLIWFSA